MVDFKKYLLKIYGWFSRPDKSSVYASCLKNTYIDKYDILNCNSSNLMKFLSVLVREKRNHPLKIYLEYADDSRLPLYEEFADQIKNNGVLLKFVRSAYGLESHRLEYLRLKISNFRLRMKCRFWLTETVESFGRECSKKYHQFCLNYFISCKNDYTPYNAAPWSHVDTYITTALLPTQVVSSSKGVRLDCCKICGFPRNDTLFHGNKKKEVYAWLTSELGYYPKHIFLYMPTYRDYECNKKETRPIMGYEFPQLANLMKESQSAFIYKVHPWQNIDAIKNTIGLLEYPGNYDFSIYDIMAVADCFIGDYSSATFDFMLRDKPIIYNIYDLNEYTEKRGLSYDPFESFCGGTIVKNAAQMEIAIKDILAGQDNCKEKRSRICHIMHKYCDDNSCMRVIRLFEKTLGEAK